MNDFSWWRDTLQRGVMMMMMTTTMMMICVKDSYRPCTVLDRQGRQEHKING
jgi:hypothetical protein